METGIDFVRHTIKNAMMMMMMMMIMMMTLISLSCRYDQCLYVQGCLVQPHIFNRPIRALFPQINREPFNINADNENYETLKA